MNREKIVIFGNSQLASLAHFYFRHDSCHEVVGFTVDRDWLTGTTFEGKPLVPFEKVEDTYPPEEFRLFAPISFKKMNDNRKQKFLEGKRKGYSFVSYVSSKATTWPDLDVGENCFIFEDNTIQPFVSIGDNCVLWSGNHIGHHSTIGSHVFITSHVVISGCCIIRDSCFFGVNSTVRDETVVEEYSLIGMGCILTRDTEHGDIWLGAKSTRRKVKSRDIKSLSHKSDG